MQLKGLVRFFTILLIIYSLYQLSFTWVVRNHEDKLEAQAKREIGAQYPAPEVKFPNNTDSQVVYREQLDKLIEARITRLEDSTKNVTVTYGITGAISYQKAKEQELSLGLDLKGGMNVTLEVEMNGLLKGLSNNPRDPNFLKALENADKLRANSDANFVRLFAQEYKKLVPGGRLASIFASANKGLIQVNDSDDKVVSILEGQAKEAFESTFKVLTNRIDQFGVAQPNISPDPSRGIITVELPGVKDKERVRRFLQASANLQFWKTYKLSELAPAIQQADAAFDAFMKGQAPAPDTAVTTATPDTTGQAAVKPDTAVKKDTNIFADLGNDTGSKGQQQTAGAENNKRSLQEFIMFNQEDGGILGYVSDTVAVRSYLTSEALRRYFPRDAVFAFGTEIKSGKNAGPLAGKFPLYALKTYGSEKAPVEGDAIKDAKQDFEQQGGSRPIVSMEMNDAGAKKWSVLTGESAKGQIPIAIVMDGIVYSAPIASGELYGNSQITGNFSVQEAKDLANILRSGKLVAPAKIVQEQTVGPTLGEEAVRGGLMSFGISFLVIFVLMLVYYNTAGWVANIALILNLLFTVGVLAGLGATLTAPGIAGLVLTIGMAVDTNVIIYERIKEELNRGKGYIPAINEGYKRSLPPVLDGHVTTLLTAVILFYFGLGPVKGFATTQILGLLLSLFCGILVSRWVTDWFTNRNKHLEYFTGVSRRIFKHAAYKFIEFRKTAYIISFVVLGLGIASFFNGFDYGVEFDGGRSYKIGFDKKVNVEQVRDELKAVFEGDNPVIKTVGDEKTLDITTAYLIKEPRADYADSVVEHKLYEGLKKHYDKTPTYEQFDASYKLGFKKVLPTISDDLKRGAVKATLFAIFVIFLYIFIRFRDWRFSLGTIVSLLHDVLVTLIVFSFAREIVPFPLEIDQHFIAAILTVIGFSMNDTVIVFDRIREDRKKYPNMELKQVINTAINETLSRTIMTSLTVFLTILILFLFGGEVTKGFAFAMLIGVITGIYSSIFVAAPILVDLGAGKRKKKEAAEKNKTV
ncbi:protein translocase subunit SecDF [Terrimonas ferruginea]|uniref:protein translocase subunit SecDF n=1 Tax=Terrimonas ferruginea TaxID=249 RepID=UPI0004135436|nr:protein translocase subunit SecDF [Terrimonas ferruginea]